MLTYVDGKPVFVYESLSVVRVDREGRARTCGYWFLIYDHATNHSACRTRKDLNRWLAERGLRLEKELEKAHDYSRIIGRYFDTGLMEPREVFDARPGERIRVMSNGDYTVGIRTIEPDGTVNLLHLNPNIRDRHVFDYRESERLMFHDWVDDEAAAMVV